MINNFKLFCLFALLTVAFWLSLRTLDLSPFDEAFWQSRYDHSQYCVPTCQFEGNIDDPELYTLAGLHYLRGADPTQINFEVQPLTKYFFGLSTMITGSPLWAQLFFGIGTLYMLYLLSKRVLPSYLALLPPLLLLIDPIFRDQLTRSFVDLGFTFWLLAYLLFLSQDQGRRRLSWGGIILGCLALSKSFSLGVLVAIYTIIVYYLHHRHEMFQALFKIFTLASLVYLLGYFFYFAAGHNLINFVELHLDILRLYKGYVPEYPRGEVFRLILLGQWQTWWGDKAIIQSPFYTLAWPASLLLSLPLYFSRRWSTAISLHLSLVLIFLLFISSRLLFPRYLLPILPSMYLLLAYSLYFATVKLCRVTWIYPSEPAKVKKRSVDQ